MNDKMPGWNDKNQLLLSEKLGHLLYKKQWRLVTAESCTGGGIVHAITAVSGSSAWCEGGFITYSNAMKVRQLGVDSSALLNYGAVSEPVVKAMAKGAITASNAEVSVAVSGVAGPEGGTQGKPIGTVWLAWCLPKEVLCSQKFCFSGDREAVRSQSVYAALQGLYSLCRGGKLCFNSN